MPSNSLLAGNSLVIGAVIAVLGVGVETASAQTEAQTPTHAAFEVASIKPNHNPQSGARAISLSAGLSHGRLVFEAVTLRDLIQQAWDLQRDQISKCPAWCDSERFDLIAKAEDPNVGKEQIMLMLQVLLADRFQLATHRETTDRPGYALIVGKNGSRLKPAGDGETLGFASAGYLRTFRKMPIAGLVSFIAGTARQPVVDMTGLTGSYDFTIDLTPAENTPPIPVEGISRSDPAEAFARLREAVEDQLGFKLEAQRVAVENLIVERAERPSEN
jgi:uncharacterized protein (TIGR03435 family)